MVAITDELIHLATGLLAGLIGWRVFGHKWVAIISGISTGFLVDVDHIYDYYLVFGSNINLKYFLKGYEFYISNTIYTIFHAWELVLLFLLVLLFAKSKKTKALFLSAALGLSFHLTADSILNDIPVSSYCLTKRAMNDFSRERLTSHRHYKKFMEDKKAVSEDLEKINLK